MSGIEENISIKIPKGVQHGDKIEINGKGYRKEDGTRGNLIVNTEIVIPTSLTNEEKDVLKKLNEITKFNPRSKI